MPTRLPKGTPIDERFWHYVEKAGWNECWIWVGGKSDTVKGGSHGILIESHDNKRTYHKVHRLSWTLHHGPIPDGLLVLHHCDVPECVNPNHLYLGTARDNALDRERRGRGGPQTQKGVPKKIHGND